MTKVYNPGLHCNLEQAPLPRLPSVAPSVQEGLHQLISRWVCEYGKAANSQRAFSASFSVRTSRVMEILTIKDFKGRDDSQPPPHTCHKMGAQIEAPASEAMHCSGHMRSPPPRRKDGGRALGSFRPQNMCPYSPCSSPEPNPILTLPTPASSACFLGALQNLQELRCSLLPV